MPKLSPTQCLAPVGTKLLKWHVQEHASLAQYALICEVETNALTDDGSNDVFQLEVEIQQDCYIAKLLYEEGDYIKAGLPIAICCDEEEELESVTETVAEIIGEIKNIDTYKQSLYSLAGFQSYTKTNTK